MANDDLISRQAAIDAVEFGITYVQAINIETGEVRDLFATTNKELKKAVERINNLPSAERRGRWEDVEHAPNGLLYATCSVCGKRQTVETTNYCGNCGSFNGEGEENAELQR